MRTLVFLLLISLVVGSYGKTLTNSIFGCSITVPPEWKAVTSSDSSIYLYDSTSAKKSQLFLNRYTINKSLYATPEAWTKSFFIAYKISVSYAQKPYIGYVLFSDSSQTSPFCKIDGRYSPVMYTLHFLNDSTAVNLPKSWAEYLHYTAFDNYGYEIYALGDTIDLKNNVGSYDSIMQTIHFSAPTSSRILNRYNMHSLPVNNTKRVTVNVLGQRLFSMSETGAQLLLNKNRTVFVQRNDRLSAKFSNVSKK